MPVPAPAQDSISRDFSQKHTGGPAVRRMTVCNSLRDIRGPNERPMRAPHLLLRGAWLQCAGFHADVPVVVDDYFDVAWDVVWDIVKQDLPPLLEQIKSLLKSTGSSAAPKR